MNPRDYAIAIEQDLERITCTVTRHSSQVTNTCWFPIEYNQGSLFGNCSCGRPSTDGVPCVHMCVVVKSHRIDGLTETNVMPKWWHTSSWRKQYPKEKTVRCTDIQTLKNTCAIGTRTNKLYALCPPYAAPKKSGRPKEATRIKGSIEMSLDKKKGKKGKKSQLNQKMMILGRRSEAVLRVQQRKIRKQRQVVWAPLRRKNGSVDTKNRSHPIIRKRRKRKLKANKVLIRRLGMNSVLHYLSNVIVGDSMKSVRCKV